MIRIAAFAALLAGAAGCAPDLTALAADRNAVCLRVTTLWGSTEISRNFGCQQGGTLPRPGTAPTLE